MPRGQGQKSDQETLLRRFYSKVVMGPNGCHQWVGGVKSKDPRKQYGTLSVNGKVRPAHVWAYEQYRGPVPSGFVVDHLCSNTRCVNPEHLEAVTNTENVRRGKKTKLTMEMAREIRRLSANGATTLELAAEFGVCRASVYHVLSNRTWAEPK